MAWSTAIRRSILQAVFLAVVLLAVTAGLEYLGVTSQGYGLSVLFSLALALVWGAFSVARSQSRSEVTPFLPAVTPTRPRPSPPDPRIGWVKCLRDHVSRT
ncbi:MAG TPA: hypothetical protein VLB85_01575 [Acidimicrobiia bacterium]|nr:hypothetical protein [Acidimicrobiia bacterium]